MSAVIPEMTSAKRQILDVQTAGVIMNSLMEKTRMTVLSADLATAKAKWPFAMVIATEAAT